MKYTHGFTPYHFSKKSKGFIMLEPVLAGALIAVVTLVVTSALVTSQQNVAGISQRMQALHLAQEGIEVLRNMRDASEDELPDGEWGLDLQDGGWQLVPTSDVTGLFTRTLTIEANAGIYDVTSEVTWPTDYGNRNVSLQSRLTDWR